MKAIKKNNEIFLTSIFIFVFTLVRLLVYGNETQLGMNFYDQSITPTVTALLFWILGIMLSGLLSAFVYLVYKKLGNISVLLCAMTVVDPGLLLIHRTHATLIVSVFGLLFLLNEIRTKPIINREAGLLVFALISAIVFPGSVFSFLPLAIVVYIIPFGDDFLKNKKALIVSAVSVALAVAGFVINTVTDNEFSFNDFFANEIPFSEKNVFIFPILSIPYVAFSVFFFKEYLKKEDVSQKSKKKKGKEKLPLTIPVATGIAYITGIAGGFVLGIESMSSVSLIIPLVCILSLVHKNENAQKAAAVNDGFLKKNFFVFIMISVLVYYFSMRLMREYILLDPVAYFFVQGG